MRLYYTDTRGADISCALCAAGSARKGSAWGRSLLCRAWEREFGSEMPDVVCDEQGRPMFAAEEAPLFSLSHTEGLAVCAIGETPVGVDAERPRELASGTAQKLMTPEESQQFDFFRLWTLRESAFKLTGRGGVRSPHFFLRDGAVHCEDERLHFALAELYGCPVSLCAPEPIQLQCIEIPVSELLRK